MIGSIRNQRDTDRARAKEALERAGRPYIVPTAILSEIAYLLEQRMPNTIDRFLEDLEIGAFSLDCEEGDDSRIRQLTQRYDDLSLGMADASVIARAERNGAAVLTLNLRDFGPVAREGTIRLLPE